MNALGIMLLSALTLSPLFLWAHGEDKPGPNGGHIRMPGGFHTEVFLRQNILEIYLLDIQFQNPTTKNSTITAKWTSKKSTFDLHCTPQETKFTCTLPDRFNAKTGSIEISAKRDGMMGGIAKYPLPLKSWPKRD